MYRFHRLWKVGMEFVKFDGLAACMMPIIPANNNQSTGSADRNLTKIIERLDDGHGLIVERNIGMACDSSQITIPFYYFLPGSKNSSGSNIVVELDPVCEDQNGYAFGVNIINKEKYRVFLPDLVPLEPGALVINVESAYLLFLHINFEENPPTLACFEGSSRSERNIQISDVSHVSLSYNPYTTNAAILRSRKPNPQVGYLMKCHSPSFSIFYDPCGREFTNVTVHDRWSILHSGYVIQIDSTTLCSSYVSAVAVFRYMVLSEHSWAPHALVQIVSPDEDRLFLETMIGLSKIKNVLAHTYNTEVRKQLLPRIQSKS